MTSWTADIEWQDLVGTPHDIAHWTSALKENSGSIRVGDDTGVITATVTLEAESLADALPVAMSLVEAVVGPDASLRRIASSDAYVG